MNPNLTSDRVRALLAQLCTTPAAEIGPDDRLGADLGFDSVASMELLGMLSDEFGIDVDLEETMGIERVCEVVALAERHIARA
ncbi:MAG: acyl carrier protein [Pseudomonadota bacterium]|nr:acyl carrier protein [Pseudomonadota bacterium]